ncbi:integrase [Methylotenera oryzisoli]|uniref:Integrase n=1 Tax=Methylotenera oryzisoli TaxID=2080758 RepID=A0A4Y9VSP8_9PROT|nr:tyrosine-type recombinase/integrase [Methylotenera oryzisoli]TFW72093.1 integrase [Methylotenera oryzisoli]
MGRKSTVNSNLPPRMRARTQKSGVTYYYYDTGKKPRVEIPLGSDYILAVKKWAELHQEPTPVPAMPTIETVWNRYVQYELIKKPASTQKDYNKCIKQILKVFNNPPAPLDLIEPFHIRKYIDYRGKSAETRANRERSLISLLWNYARANGYTSKANPCTGITGFTEKKRDVYIADEVYAAVYACADQPTKDALDLSYLTAQRPADVIKMYQTDIQENKLIITQNKTGAKISINIIGELELVIKRIKARKETFKVHSLALIVDEHGKPLSQRAIWTRFDKARKQAAEDNPKLKAQIEEYQIRDLRAKGGTDKAVDQDDIRQAQKLLGHSSVVMTERYVREIRGQNVDPTK